MRKRIRSGVVPDWTVQMEVRVPNARGFKLDFKVDTQSDYTVIPLSIARRIGLNPDELKRNGTKILIGTACHGRLTGYLQQVEFALDDDFGGWAQWLGTAAFCEPDAKDHYAGKIGFLEFLRFADAGPEFTLDPVAGFPGRFQCSTRQLANP
jgi:hypothetical protein